MIKKEFIINYLYEEEFTEILFNKAIISVIFVTVLVEIRIFIKKIIQLMF